MSHPVVVVGGGPAGLMAALSAAEDGARVLLFEQLRRPGAKLLVTGGGRCNLTNQLDAPALAEAFGKRGRFMRPALAGMDGPGLCRFMAGIGLPTCCPDGFHVYPADHSALSVRDALLRRCAEAGVAVETHAGVTALDHGNGRVRAVETVAGRHPASAVVLATGGCSYAALGAAGSGYAFARAAGHTVVSPVPALVPLVMKEGGARGLAGVSVPAAEVRVDRKGVKARRAGSVLFTHRGLSGPLILDLSGEVSALLAIQGEVVLCMNWCAGQREEDWLSRFGTWHRTAGRKMIRSLLGEHVPGSCAALLCEAAGLGADARAMSFSRAQRLTLAQRLTATRWTVTATEGWSKAMVTRGGVALDEVDSRTLMSRRIEGLYFAGELLDLDGPCGGYNLTWAFASGYLAGRDAAMRGQGLCQG